MKATGIVRRIDDLGRVVIPKEIRRTMRIREGDPLEIFTDRDGEVIFKKYSPIGELGEFAVQYAETLSKTSGHSVCITDKESVIAVSGASKKEILEKRISSSLAFNKHKPFANFSAFSMESCSREREFSFFLMRSITISRLCFLFLSRTISSSKSLISPST